MARIGKVMMLLFTIFVFATPAGAVILDSKTIPKYVNQLAAPPVLATTKVLDLGGHVVRETATVTMSQFQQQLLPPGAPNNFPMTTVWGYNGTSPGPTFEATKGIPMDITYVNNITGPSLFPVDPTLHWADPNGLGMVMPPFTPFPPGYPLAQSPVPTIPHLHGGETPSIYDGHPEAWFTAGGIKGPTALPGSQVFTYLNTQLPTTLWYHDHSLGMTRLNVASGLAGFYLLRDPADTLASVLPSGAYEMPLVIQDRTFNTDGSLFFTQVGNDPNTHPYWDPEFFGNAIMVNGKVWPNMNVEPRQYRFRILDGSNARVYTLSLSNGASFVQIGSDGGYLPAAANMKNLSIAPGERCDVLVDFSKLKPGTKVVMMNSAKAPFPNGAPADPQTVGQIMQFTVVNAPKVTPAALPATLATIPTLTPDVPTRIVSLLELAGPLGPVMVTLNGQMWSAPPEETPRVGSTEMWEIVNMTADTHPIHLHLIQFQLKNRQAINTSNYLKAWLALNVPPNWNGMDPLTHATIPLDPTPYLQNGILPPDANETGWKDTIKVPKGTVTRIMVRYAPQDANPALAAPGVNLFPFDPTSGPGYVWHCHILDHEDNEMMRPQIIMP